MIIKTPRFVELELTSKCNLRCSYCYHFNSPGDVTSNLTTSDWLSFFDELGRYSVIRVTLSGGEPLIRPDLPDLIAGIIRNKMRFKIVTNGTLINESIVDNISSTNRCDMIYVSLDGSESKIHDSCRGNGNFKKTIDGLKLLKKSQIPVSVRATIHKNNYHNLEQIAHLVLNELNVDYFSANIASYLGSCKEHKEHIVLNTLERSQAIQSLFNLKSKYGDRIDDFGLVSEVNSWLKIAQSHIKREQVPINGGCLSACNEIFDTISIRADGAITPCAQLNHIVLGKINKDNLIDIWQSHPALQAIRNRSCIKLSNFTFCQDCEYLEYCKGGCPGLSYSILGLENHPNPESCLKKYLSEGGSLPYATFI